MRVTDTDAPSYVGRPVAAVLATTKEEKKIKYLSAIEACHASFTPFVVSVDGAMARDASVFLKHLADKLSCRWGDLIVKRSYGQKILWSNPILDQGAPPLFGQPVSVLGVTCLLA